MEDMAKRIPGLTKRTNGIWYYRARVPKDLLPFYGKRERWISLGTSDRQEAVTEFHLKAAEISREYSEMSQRRGSIIRKASTDKTSVSVFKLERQEAVRLAKAFLAERLSSQESKMTAAEYPNQGNADDVRVEISGDLGNLLDPEGSDDARFEVGNLARKVLENNGHRLEPLQPVDDEFLRIMRRTLVALHTIQLKRLDGNFEDNPQDAMLTDFANVRSALRSVPISALTIRQAVDKFWTEEITVEKKATKTLLRYEAAINLLVRFLGDEALLSDITKDQLVSYRDTLIEMPSNYSKRFSPIEPFDKIVAETKLRNLPRMQFKTREIYVSLMKRVFKWAAANDIVRKDISMGIKIGGHKVAERKKRRPFTAAELNSIFCAPVFTGCLNDERGYAKVGSNRPKRSRFWVPLIALYTGMRMGEILQLRVDHVRCSPEGNHYFYLTDGFGEEDGDQDFIGMELKTFNSRREVPIHSVLQRAGFLSFVDKARRSGGGELFPEVPRAADGKKSSVFSKRFSRFLHKAGIKPEGHGNCFHMFRHTLRDVIRNGIIPEEIADAVQGWARDENVGRNYGLGFTADAIAPIWEELSYKGFDYGHLLENDVDAAMQA